MKKKFSKIKHLFGGEPDASIGITDDTEMEVEWVEPQTLLTPARLDLPIKIKYIEAYEKGWDTKFFADMYDAHIRAFSNGTYTEPSKPEKNSFFRTKSRQCLQHFHHLAKNFTTEKKYFLQKFYKKIFSFRNLKNFQCDSQFFFDII